MTDVSGTHSVIIDAPRELCARILLDVEAYPAWYGTLDAVSVLERDQQGRAGLVRAVADAGPLGSVEFHLRQTYRLPDAIEGVQAGGNGRVVDVRNGWDLEALDGERTRATYRFEANAGGRRTGLVLRGARTLVERALVNGFADGLKHEAERRAQAGES